MTPPNRATRLPTRWPAATCLLLVLPLLALAGCAGDDGATTHLEIRFGDGRPDASYTVRSDLGSRPTAAMYDRDGVPHPDAYTVHDQLEDWSRQTGKAYTATSYADTGFGAGYFLTGLDGLDADEASAYWALTVDGQESQTGMSQATVADGGQVVWAFTRVDTSASADPDPIGVTIDPPAATRTQTAVLTGSVNHPATVSIDGGPSIEAEAGRWSLGSGPLAYGQNPARVRIEDGVHSVVRDVVFVRLSQATLEAVFTASPDHDTISSEVWYDPSHLASAAMYEGSDVERATTYTVHDLMVDWTAQTGTVVEYGGPGAFGFSVESIDGIGQPLDSSLPPYWCYTVNGESASLGISLQTVAPGDVVTWEYSTCV
jgi:hypothetical protein